MTPEERKAWLAERRTGIGGSDAAPAVGMSKYKTRLELYLDKRGELETTETEPMRWGNLLEPVVRQEYANRTGNSVTVPPGIIRHPSTAFAIVTADGIVNDGQRLYEGKTARTAEGWGEPGSGDVPQEYFLQCQHGLYVTGLPIADVAVLIGGSDFRIYHVEADAELQAMLIEQEAAFWNCVQRAEPPEPTTAEDVKRRWRICRGTTLTVDSESTIASACQRLADIKQLQKLADSAVEELTVMVQATMGDAAEIATSNGDLLATWKNIKASARFDLERFREEQPELYQSYLREAQPQRRFLLKVKGDPSCQLPLPNDPIPRLETASAT